MNQPACNYLHIKLYSKRTKKNLFFYFIFTCIYKYMKLHKKGGLSCHGYLL